MRLKDSASCPISGCLGSGMSGVSNAIIFYNSAILSLLLTKYEAAGNAKALALITQMSPAAWRHILLNGHYTFQTDGKFIDLDALVAGLELG